MFDTSYAVSEFSVGRFFHVSKKSDLGIVVLFSDLTKFQRALTEKAFFFFFFLKLFDLILWICNFFS